MSQLSLHQRHIVITRPPAQANTLQSLLSVAGATSHLFPLIDIVALQDYSAFEAQLTRLDSYDWAIFISSNAVQNAMPYMLKAWPQMPSSLKFAAIGPSTAQSLAQYGISQVLVPEQRFDSESLLALPQMQAVQQQKVLIFRGVGGREVLADTLRTRGAEVDFAECYRRINPQQNLATLYGLWQKKQLDAIVLTSSEAMRYLLDMVEAEQADWMHEVLLCVNHARIAQQPQALAYRVAVAEAPGDAAMLQCLQNAFSH